VAIDDERLYERLNSFKDKFRQGATTERRRDLYLSARANDLARRRAPSRRSDREGRENSLAFVVAVISASLHGPPLANPRGSLPNLSAVAASTSPRALPPDLLKFI